MEQHNESTEWSYWLSVLIVTNCYSMTLLWSTKMLYGDYQHPIPILIESSEELKAEIEQLKEK